MEKEKKGEKSSIWSKIKEWLSLRWVQVSVALSVVGAAVAVFFFKLMGRDTRGEREVKNEVEAAERDLDIENSHNEKIEEISQEQKKEEEYLYKEVMRRLRRIKKENVKKKKESEDVIMNGSREDVESYLRRELEKEKE